MHGPCVRPEQHHEPVDRRRPRPDPGQGGQRLVDPVVIERREPVDVQRAVLDGRRQRPGVACLLAAEPDREQLARRRGAGTSTGSADRPSRASRSKAACADASETCCSRIRWTSVGKPGARAHSGGGPNRSTTARKTGSDAARPSTASRSRASVSGAGTVITRSSTPPRGEPLRASEERRNAVVAVHERGFGRAGNDRAEHARVHRRTIPGRRRLDVRVRPLGDRLDACCAGPSAGRTT